MMKVLNYMLAALFCSYIVIFTWVICVTPAYSFVGYARVIDKISLEIAKKQAVKEAIAIAAAAGGGTAAKSIGLRVITAGTGWLGLGIILGITALEWYYSKNDLNTVYSNAAQAVGGGWYTTISNTQYQVNYPLSNTNYSTQPEVRTGSAANIYLCFSDATRDYLYGPVIDGQAVNMQTKYGWPPKGNGWYDWVCGSCGNTGCAYHYLAHYISTPTTAPSYVLNTPTQTDIENWFTNNPGHSLSVENKSTSVGYQGSPTPADELQTMEMTSTEVTTSLKPADQIASTDIVLGDGFQAPQGTESTQTQTQTLTSTRTETITQNPDGSTTTQTQEEETSTAACTAGSHIQKTTGTVIQEHIDRWQQSGLLAALSGLKNIVWSSSLPTITFTSARWGSHSINMNDWAWVFASVKVVMIAGATLVSYRLVFG